MINNQKVLGIIPARGGSKTLPRKNIKMLAGKPLIAWTIEEGKKSAYIDRLIISSDDMEIIKVSQDWGGEVPFVRPAELARDQTGGVEPVIHALNSIGEYYNYTVLLQPTSPLRSVSDIDGCIHYCISQGAPACVSVSLADKSPYWMFSLAEEGKMMPLIETRQPGERRQDLPVVHVLNGAIYLAQTDYLIKAKTFITDETIAYIMPADRSLDIDTELDFIFCDLIKSRLLLIQK